MSDSIMLTEERRRVIDNISSALNDNDSFRKVELFDPIITDDDRQRVIVNFDNRRKGPLAKAKAFAARKLAESMTEKINESTVIVGLENILSLEGAAIITSNHYAPTDSTPIRIAAKILGVHKNLHIIVQESNIFMTGLFGFIMKNCNTHPVSKSPEYTVKNLKPFLNDLFKERSLLLVYPEQEMWRNFKKPRPLRDGAYHWAAYYNIPIIPTFTEMQTSAGERDQDGFLPIKHTLHIGKPIYPDPKLSIHENRDIMLTNDYNFKKTIYEDAYKITLDNSFVEKRDIAGVSID